MKIATFDVSTLTLIASVFIPLLVGLSTKFFAKSQLKAAVNLLFSALSAGITTLIAGGGVLTREALRAFIVTYIISVATYYGFWKPSTISGRLNIATMNFGLGENKITGTQPWLLTKGDLRGTHPSTGTSAAVADPGPLAMSEVDGTEFIGDVPNS